MTTNHHTEESYENTLIQLFQDLGYQYECGYNVEREYRNPYYEADLQDALRRQNPILSDEVLQEAFRLVTHVNEGILEQRNETLMDYVQNGVEVKYSEDGRAKTALVKLVNFESPLQNQFKVVNQWTVVEYEKIRCDMVVFVNGLPLVVIELKSPTREEASDEDAYREYQRERTARYSKEERDHYFWRKSQRNRKIKKAKQVRVERATSFSKQELQAINHGKM